MKKIVSFLLALTIVFSFGITAFADNSIPNMGDESTSTVEPRIEELEWVFRVYNGNIEKRLWSNTYGVWRTDWMIVGPYPGA